MNLAAVEDACVGEGERQTRTKALFQRAWFILCSPYKP